MGGYASAGASSIGGSQGAGWRARAPRYTAEIVELSARQDLRFIRKTRNRPDTHSLLACNGPDTLACGSGCADRLDLGCVIRDGGMGCHVSRLWPAGDPVLAPSEVAKGTSWKRPKNSVADQPIEIQKSTSCRFISGPPPVHRSTQLVCTTHALICVNSLRLLPME